MQSVRIHAYGGPEALRYEEAPDPEPAEGEALVRVHAAGVNPVDAWVREGRLAEMLGHELPLVLGWDVSGTVERSGGGFEPGDEVYARIWTGRPGAYAGYIAVPAPSLARKPQTLDHAHAAALPLVSVTAWRALFEEAGLQVGETVLVHGAAGGVGHVAVQLARHAGARVVATAVAEDHGFIGGLGADHVVDYTAGPFEDAVREAVDRVDVVLDLVGGETTGRSLSVVRRGGRLVSTVQEPDAERAGAAGVAASFFIAMPSGEILTRVAWLVDGGHIRVEVAAVLPLADARAAHERMETAHARGKIVLAVA